MGDDDPSGMGGPTGGELQELKSIKDFEDFINHSDASVIGAFMSEKIDDPNSKRPSDWNDEEDGEWEPPTIDNPPVASFKSISSSLYEYRFAYTTASTVLEKLKTK